VPAKRFNTRLKGTMENREHGTRNGKYIKGLCTSISFECKENRFLGVSRSSISHRCIRPETGTDLEVQLYQVRNTERKLQVVFNH